MIGSWENAWAEFVPFLEFPTELRKIVYTTNAIESLNARFRRAVRHRGHFPNEQAALKVLYLVAHETRSDRPQRPHGGVAGRIASNLLPASGAIYRTVICVYMPAT
jgi:putative transposase